LTTGPTADSQVGFEIGRLPKPQWRIRESPFRELSITLNNASISFVGSYHRLFNGTRRTYGPPVELPYPDVLSFAHFWHQHSPDPELDSGRLPFGATEQETQSSTNLPWRITRVGFASAIDCFYRIVLPPFQLWVMDRRCESRLPATCHPVKYSDVVS
jgi:hypothetical protein